MSRKNFLLILFFICTFLFTFVPLSAQEEEGEIIIISERVGKEIDQEEREKFSLFQGINGFQSAVFIKLPDNRYLLKITYLDENSGELKIKRSQHSEASIKNSGDYIDRFEEIQAEKQKNQDLSKPHIVSSDSGEIQADQDTVYQKPGTAFFLELGGKPGCSVNVDFRINKSNRFSFGIHPLYNGSIIPSLMYYYLGGKNSNIEVGGGFSIIHSGVPDHFTRQLFHGVVGYRYQKKSGKLFRIGFTPLIIPDGFFPWIGISFGYSL